MLCIGYNIALNTTDLFSEVFSPQTTTSRGHYGTTDTAPLPGQTAGRLPTMEDFYQGEGMTLN